MIIPNVRVKNLTKGKVFLDEAKIAGTFFLRLKGLIGQRKLPPGKGLVIVPCNSIHTVGMTFPIDVVFVEKGGRVCFLAEDVWPYRFVRPVRGAYLVIETRQGEIKRKQVEVGDVLELFDK